jgi:glycine dehydrogenase
MEDWSKNSFEFARRHLGPDPRQVEQMLAAVGEKSLDNLIDSAVPTAIRFRGQMDLADAVSEYELLNILRDLAAANEGFRSFIGMGYTGCITPPVIQRNILENPGWYTQYTPYQSEIAQGRLEALLNFQTMICELTGMELSNASLLDEATAAAEAMAMLFAVQRKNNSIRFFVDERCHPQTIAVVVARAQARGWQVDIAHCEECDLSRGYFGALVQYPCSDGEVVDYRSFVEAIHSSGALIAFASDPLALCLLKPPGELGADAVVGSAQRFGMPMGYGGPHAAFLAVRTEYKRQLPGRVIGVSRDARGKVALRMALQTREQHIRRENATSNICTAQVLPAVVSSMYGLYHGPDGLRRIASGIHASTRMLAQAIEDSGLSIRHRAYFDTLRVEVGVNKRDQVLLRSRDRRINLRDFGDGDFAITLDETAGIDDIQTILFVLVGREIAIDFSTGHEGHSWGKQLSRQSPFMQHPVFSQHRSETQMLRYIHLLQSRDLSLTHSMIPLGSCTMKLNATAEMMPITWPAFANLHPFVDPQQAKGYQQIFTELVHMLREITGFAGVSLQPNAGSQGEYAGLLVIRRFHRECGESERDICLIPASAHGTNPASAVMAGMRVVVIACDDNGNIDVADLRTKATEHAEELAALMVTYPSTHGVFEQEIRTVCQIVHENGGQVYMDGANMNALVGLCRPADIGMDVCHLNLHKTFCIPHGGGGPGMGPIAVAEHLVDFLPSHPIVEMGGNRAIGSIAAAPWSSAVILLISWSYIKMMGSHLVESTRIAILNANYIARRLDAYFPVLYKGATGWVAHECIIDLRWCKRDAGITVEDVAKRLIDYGFHAPTVSFPVPGTMMVEPTESESIDEMDRFCEAMIAIRKEINEIITGQADRDNNPLKNAPHTLDMVLALEWDKPYSREKAALPAPWLAEHKFWPHVARLDNAQGDRNLVCSCPPLEAYM